MSANPSAVQPAVIAVSGPIGSGKTTITHLLSERLQWPHAAYGDLIRSVATGRGLTHDRANLQQIGTELINAGWEAFTRLVLGQASWMPGEALILDGLRHLDAATALTQIVAPLPTYVVYLDVPAARGIARAHRRDHLPDDPSRQEELHPVELDLPTVRGWADLVLPTTDNPPHLLVDRIIDHLPAQPGRQPGDRCT